MVRKYFVFVENFSMKIKMKNNEIGGFIELEIPQKKLWHSGGVFLNSARNALRLAIRLYHIQKIHLPFYTCPVIWQAAQMENVSIIPYEIDENFLPKKTFSKNDCIFYIDYFGVCENQSQQLSKKYPFLFLDCAMSFYAPKITTAQFYSPRKFFGVADGGILLCDKKNIFKLKSDFSFERFSHLIKRIEGGSNFSYDDFNYNDDQLLNAPILKMSRLTQKMLGGIDYKNIQKKRLKNFSFFHQHLKKYNRLNLKQQNYAPMYYPFWHSQTPFIRKAFLKNKIYCPKPWRDLEGLVGNHPCVVEREFFQNLLPLIIDQRYNENDLQKMLTIIQSFV